MDLQKAVEFLLEQQARIEAQSAARHERLEARHEQLQELVGRIAQQQLEMVHYVDGFQREISAAVLAIAEEQRRLAEAQRHTDESLNALINVVDSMVRRPPH